MVDQCVYKIQSLTLAGEVDIELRLLTLTCREAVMMRHVETVRISWLQTTNLCHTRTVV